MGTVNGLVCWGKSEPETPETMDFPIDFPIFCMEISVQAEHVPKTLQQTKPVRVIILAIFFWGITPRKLDGNHCYHPKNKRC
jgi:hypothetical protein